MSRRIGIFSDIHGNQYAWREFLKTLESLKLDELIFCGDIFGYYYGQDEIIGDMLKMSKLTWLLGNHDHYYLEMEAGRLNAFDLAKSFGASYLRHEGKLDAYLDFLQTLRPEARLIRDDISLKLTHGTPEKPLDGRLYPVDFYKISEKSCGQNNSPAESSLNQRQPSGVNLLRKVKSDIVIMGHTHFRFCKTIAGKLIINPGSLGQPRDKQAASFAILTLPRKTVEFVDINYKRQALAEEIIKYDKANVKLLELLFRSPS